MAYQPLLRAGTRRGLLTLAGLALAASMPLQAADQGVEKGKNPFRVTEVSQPEGGIVYWVLPGPRVLGEETFGTPDNPKALFGAG